MLKTDYLRAQDVLVACRLWSLGRRVRSPTASPAAQHRGRAWEGKGGGPHPLPSHDDHRREWTYSDLAASLGLSAGEAHNAVDRCRLSGLYLPSREIAAPVLRDLLVVAVPRIFYAQRGEIAVGLVTGATAPPLRGKFQVGKNALPLVWPSEEKIGRRGESMAPIYPTAALAARDEMVYELLALVDVLRVGGVAERERAEEIMDELLLGRGTREEEGA